MTTLIILAATYSLSFYILRKLFIKEKLTDGAAMFLVVCPFLNTLGVITISIVHLVDGLEGKFDLKAIAKKFFGELDK